MWTSVYLVVGLPNSKAFLALFNSSCINNSSFTLVYFFLSLRTTTINENDDRTYLRTLNPRSSALRLVFCWTALLPSLSVNRLTILTAQLDIPSLSHIPIQYLPLIQLSRQLGSSHLCLHVNNSTTMN